MVNVSVCWSILNILVINSLENVTLTTLSGLNVNDVGAYETSGKCTDTEKKERGVCYSCSEYNPYCQSCNYDFTCSKCMNGYHLNGGICISLLHMNLID